MLRWLLKYEGYPPGVVFAVLLHGILIAFLIGRQFDAKDLVPAEKPVFITATLIQDNPQQQRTEQRRKAEQQQLADRQREQRRQAEVEKQRQAAVEKQRQETAAAKQREADAQKQRQADAEKQRQADAEKQRQAEALKQRQDAEKQAAAEKQRQADAEKQRQAEAEKQRQAEAEKQRQAAAEKQRQAEAEKQRQAEAAAQAAAVAEAEAAATNLVQQYSATIMGLFYDCWKTPALARTGMVAQIEIRMVPTGEIVSGVITSSSGDAAFDRSVEESAQCVKRVPEMMDLPSAVFDRNFRVFTVTLDFNDVLR
jgi:colicin import membrane protein